MWEWHGAGSGGGFIFMWLFWIFIIVVVVMLIKGLVGDGKDPSEETALDVLKKRFARGEIDEEEFNRRKKELNGK